MFVQLILLHFTYAILFLPPVVKLFLLSLKAYFAGMALLT